MKQIIIPVLIILIGAGFRFSFLSQLPPSLYADEVDAGFQADIFRLHHSDYYGNPFPIHFHSFSDWRTSAYIYSVAFIKNFISHPELSVRLPSAIFSFLSLIIFYLITRSRSALFLLAISPWSIHYGRTGFEVSGMMLFLLLGIYFLHRRQFFFSIISFALTPYFYSTAKLYLLLIFPLVLFLWRSHIFRLPVKKILLLLLLSLALLSPMFYDTLRGHSGFRFSYISIFTMPHREQVTDALRYQDILLDHRDEIGVPTPLLSYIFHNKYQLVFQKFVDNYLSSFSTDFLFQKGDSNLRHGFGGHGLLYQVDFLTILVGIFIFISKPGKLGKFFFLLLVLSPIPFALTRDSDSPHATRLILMLPSLIYFSHLALKRFYWLFPVYIVSAFSFVHYYYYHYPQDTARYWHTGIKQAVIESAMYPDRSVYFSSQPEPFMPFFLYYTSYQSVPRPVSVNNESFSGQVLDSRFYFGRLNLTHLDLLPSGSVVIISSTDSSSAPSGLNLLKTITPQFQNQETYYLYEKT